LAWVDIIITTGIIEHPKHIGTLFDLEKAIAMHLEKERKYLDKTAIRACYLIALPRSAEAAGR
jgi:hypothetical protein